MKQDENCIEFGLPEVKLSIVWKIEINHSKDSPPHPKEDKQQWDEGQLEVYILGFYSEFVGDGRLVGDTLDLTKTQMQIIN